MHPLPGRRAARRSSTPRAWRSTTSSRTARCTAWPRATRRSPSAVADAAEVFGVPLMGMAGTLHEAVYAGRGLGVHRRVLRRPRLRRRRLADHHPQARRLRPGEVARRVHARARRGRRGDASRQRDPDARGHACASTPTPPAPSSWPRAVHDALRAPRHPDPVRSRMARHEVVTPDSRRRSTAAPTRTATRSDQEGDDGRGRATTIGLVEIMKNFQAVEAEAAGTLVGVPGRERGRGRTPARPSPSSTTAHEAAAGRQPRGDRGAGHPRRPRPRARGGRGAQRGRRRGAARAPGRRGGARSGRRRPARATSSIDGDRRGRASAGADAVHPGYGFLSERAEFAARGRGRRACASSGPTPEHIALMGDKARAREAAARRGRADDPGQRRRGRRRRRGGGRGGRDRLSRSCSRRPAAAAGAASGSSHDEDGAAQRASRPRRGEAASAFGDARMYVERFVRPARHVEVQVLGDGERRGPSASSASARCSGAARRWSRRRPRPGSADAVRERLCDGGRRAVRRDRLPRRRHRRVPRRRRVAASSSSSR